MTSSLSIVIPAYNEVRRLEPTLRSIAAYVREHRPDHEIIVVDAASTDGTGDLVRRIAAEEPTIRVLVQPVARGKGSAVKVGMLAATKDHVLFSDADLATPIEEVEKLEAKLAQGGDIAIGSRHAAGADVQVRQPLHRQVMGRTFNLIVRAAGVGDIADTQCGFKLFTRAAAHDLFARSRVDGFAFDVEILWLARRRYRVAEVPIVWRDDAGSKVSPLADSARMFGDLVRIRWMHRGER